MPVDRVFEGRELAEALAAAAAATGIPEAELHYEILEQGRRGLFGLGAKSVRIRILDTGSEAEPVVPPARSGPPATTASETPARTTAAPANSDSVVATLQRMVDLAGLDARVTVGGTDDGLDLVLTGPDRALLVQKDGELLSAIEFLINRMARRSWPEVARILVTVDGKRPRSDRDILDRIRDVAKQVARTGKPRRLQPMNAYERRLVHLTVREFAGLATRSEGTGPLKRVSIFKQPGS